MSRSLISVCFLFFFFFFRSRQARINNLSSLVKMNSFLSMQISLSFDHYIWKDFIEAFSTISSTSNRTYSRSLALKKTSGNRCRWEWTDISFFPLCLCVSLSLFRTWSKWIVSIRQNLRRENILPNKISFSFREIFFSFFFVFWLVSNSVVCLLIDSIFLGIFMREEIFSSLNRIDFSYLLSNWDNRRMRCRRGLKSYEKLLWLVFMNKRFDWWSFQAN